MLGKMLANKIGPTLEYCKRPPIGKVPHVTNGYGSVMRMATTDRLGTADV